MKKILLLGERSYAASGLYKLLKENGFGVDCFSRGEGTRKGDFVTGDVFNISLNSHLPDQYDIVINFILIKNESIDSNISFIKEVDKLCRLKKVKNLIHISSISCYAGNMDYVDEKSEIEKNHENKGGYGAIKVAVDNFLASLEKPYKLSFIRPGFIFDSDSTPDISGIGRKLLNGIAIIMGNNKTPLTLINRKSFHEGLLRVIKTGCSHQTYLMFENNDSTKRDFLQNNGYKTAIPLNKLLVVSAARMLQKIGLFSPSQLEQVKSLFRKTEYNCYQTEYNLQYSFIADSFCIIGAGTYGSYLADKIRESQKDAFITVFDVGNEKIKNEEEIGYRTNILRDPYTGTSDGRFFGFGGTSTKWGGQLLTFSENDFNKPTGFLHDIIKLNQKHRDNVYRKFNINDTFEEKHIDTDNGLFIKTGFWLGYFRRNLFKYFRVRKIDNLKIIADSRIARLLTNEKFIKGIEYIKTGEKRTARFDRYFLCAGAFESFRILLSSNLMPNKSVAFSDHLSQKVFLVKGPAKIGEDDFTFRVNGSSLITKRIIGEIDNVSFYVNPNFNDNFPFFQNLKTLLFKKEFSYNLLKSMIVDLPDFIRFVWSIFIKRRIYAYNNEWEIKIDIENPTLASNVALSDSIDEFGINSLDVEFIMDNKASELYKKIHMLIKDYLDKHKVKYSEIADEIHVTKCEDTYHPYGMLDNINSVDEYFNWFDNMLVVNTGILPRAGGINTAGAVFPIIEEYFSRNSENNASQEIAVKDRDIQTIHALRAKP